MNINMLPMKIVKILNDMNNLYEIRINIYDIRINIYDIRIKIFDIE
jgi:hypothetical protein